MGTHRAEPFPAGRLILASSSPQRSQLLSQAGYQFSVIAPRPEAEGDPLPGEAPTQSVLRLARAKAADVLAQLADQPTRGQSLPARGVSNALIVACDTLAECQGRLLGKPKGAVDAREMLHWLRGKEHAVHSGLCLWEPGGAARERVATTRLLMAPLSAEAIEEYIASGLWQGKAGAFGYQDRLDWLSIVEGSESNVIGLPLELLAQMLADSL